MRFITPIKISPLAQRRTSGGGGGLTQILDIEHEWFMPNVQNADGNIITIPNSGSVGGVNFNNPALANKPIASTINGLISYKGNNVDKYIYKSTENFAMTYPNWMCHIVFKYDSSAVNEFLSAFNETNINNEGWTLRYHNTAQRFAALSFNISGTAANRQSNVQALTNGQNYIITIAYNGTSVLFYLGNTLIGTVATANPFTVASNTNNLAMFALIKHLSSTGNSFGPSDNGYVGLDPYNATKLTNNTNTLKALYGIA